MEMEVSDMAGTERLLEAIDKMTLALQELREAVLELTAEGPAEEPKAAAAEEPVPTPLVIDVDGPAEVIVSDAPPAPASEPVTVWQGTPEPASALEPEPAPVEKRCPVCGDVVKPSDRFCMKCGASIPEDAPAADSGPSNTPIQPLSSTASFVPFISA